MLVLTSSIAHPHQNGIACISVCFLLYKGVLTGACTKESHLLKQLDQAFAMEGSSAMPCCPNLVITLGISRPICASGTPLLVL